MSWIRLIKQLSASFNAGRMQNNDLADLVGLSSSPCLRRVRRLEADGVIAGYSVVVDREAVGCAYEPIVGDPHLGDPGVDARV